MYAKFGGSNKEYYGIFQSGLFINIWEILRRVFGKREMLGWNLSLPKPKEFAFRMSIVFSLVSTDIEELVKLAHFLANMLVCLASHVDDVEKYFSYGLCWQALLGNLGPSFATQQK